MLRAMEKAKAGRPPKNRSHESTDFRGAKTLDDLGITYSQSSQWQKLTALFVLHLRARAPVAFGAMTLSITEGHSAAARRRTEKRAC